MGMFDSVFARCQQCGEPIEFQSKAGECILSRFSDDAVPAEIAIDLDGQGKCCPKCDTVNWLMLPFQPSRVSMIATTSNPNIDYED